MLWKLVSGLAGIVVTVLGFVFVTDRKEQNDRISDIEAKISNMVTKPELDSIAEKIEKKFSEDHGSIIETIKHYHDLQRSDIQEIREFMFNHLERRGKDR